MVFDRKVTIRPLAIIVSVALAVSGAATLGAAALLGGLDEAVRVAPLAGALFAGCALPLGFIQLRRATPVREAHDPESSPEPGESSATTVPGMAAPAVVPETGSGPVDPPHQVVSGSQVRGHVIQLRDVVISVPIGRDLLRVGRALMSVAGFLALALVPALALGLADSGTSAAPGVGSGPSAAPVPPVAVTADGDSGYAEFHRDERRFVIHDGRKDEDAVFLLFRTDGRDQKPVPNSDGKTGVLNDKTGKVPPPKVHHLPALKPDAAIDFQVCLGNAGRQLTIKTETCGGWVTAPAR
ncbi:hypothetical protein GCM10017556_44280 [Micromonospora sagamiensis]|uniref:Uncharacterized protein n=4 Tax=Micromonospora sagamiensis TaxID=47875 RepID=A0A562WJQ9_9ACTN|nr:hypothetical protein JD81_03819 [Micromonospora sagamiensis]BCL16689.1 hypothetical protein GCM10017556_44280 [Micromonospora sagamiensis]